MDDSVGSVHAAVDAEVERIASANRDRLNCKAGCASCCVDDITVFEVEAERIRREFPEVLQGEAHPAGACAFLDEADRCRVYSARPYVCRTQGLPLAWVEEDGEGWVEHRDICSLNAEGPDLVQLPQTSVWAIGPFEGRLASVAGPERRRVALRDLFRD